MQLILLLMSMVLMNKIFITGFLFFISFIQAEECLPEPNASVYFISPQNNYVSKSSEVKIVFGIKNFDILPAGIIGCNSGHHHLVINAELPNLSRPIPSSMNYIHFGMNLVYSLLLGIQDQRITF